MGDVKRFTPDTFGDGVVMVEVRADERYETSDETEFCEARDVARLERERDECDAAASGLCGEVAELTMRLEKAQAELTRLRAVEELAQRLVGLQYAQTGPQISEMYATLDALAEACGRKG